MWLQIMLQIGYNTSCHLVILQMILVATTMNLSNIIIIKHSYYYETFNLDIELATHTQLQFAQVARF